MDSNSKIQTLAVVLSIMFIVVLMASLAAAFHIPYHALENKVAMENFQHCLDSLNNEKLFLDRLLVDWAAWDSTADFINGKNPDYVRENLSDNTLQEQKLNVFCLIDTKGKIVWSRCVEFFNEELRTISLSMFTDESLQKNHILWNHASPDSSISGYCTTENGILMLVSYPVTNNDNTGPVQGTLIMGRFITDKYLVSITKQASLEFNWWNIKNAFTRSAMSNYLFQITDQEPIFLEFEDNTVAAYTILHDIKNTDAILIKSTLPNLAVFFKKDFRKNALIIFAVESIFFLFALTIGLTHRCIRCEQSAQQFIQPDTP